MKFKAILTLFMIGFLSSCMKEEVKLEGSFELDGFDFDVNAPTIRLAASTAPYEKSSSPSLRVVTGADLLNCSSFTHFAITETASEPGDSAFTYTCSQTGSQIVTYNLTDTTEGNRTLYFWGKDKSRGKVSRPASLSFIYDETAPTGTLGTLPGLVRGGDTQALSLTSGDNIAFDTFTLEFTTDGSTWSEIGTYTESTTSADLNIPVVDSPNGQIRVSYIDKAKNTMSLTSSTFTVDSAAPTLSITDLASYLSDGDTVNITFSVSDLNGMDTWELQYTTDGSTYSTIATDPTSPYSWTVPASETTTGAIRLVGTDNAGNIDQTSTANFTVDATAPSVSLGAVSSPLRGGNTTTVTYTVTDASPIASMTLEYAADGSTYTSLGTVTGSSYTWTIPSDNTSASRLRLTAVDAAGNSASTISNAFVVDSTAPTVTLNNVASLLRGGNTESVVFTTSDTNGIASTVLSFSSNSGTTYSTVATNPSSPYTWTIPSLDTTTNILQLVVTDNAGNVTTVTNSTFTIDSTAPSLSLTDPSSLLRGGNTESITFTSSDTHGVASTSLQFASNGTTFSEIVANPTSPYTWTIPSDDTTSAKLRFVVTDNAGNVSQTDSSAFTIDSTVPTLSINNLASVIRGGSTESVTFSASDSSGFSNLIVEYAADGSTYSTLVGHPANSPYSWSVPSVDTTGSKLRISATDNAGNSNSVETSAFNIDSTAPSVTLADLAAAIRGGSSTNVTFTTSDANGVATTILNYAADGTTFSTQLASGPTSPYSWSVPSVDTTGSKLQLVVTDVVGNSTNVENAAFNIDSTAPTLSISAIPSPLMGGNSQNITFTNTDSNGVASLLLEYSLDGISYTTISASPTSPHSWTIPSSDTVNADIRLTGTDSVGNSTSVTSNTFTIDSTAPTVDITDLAAAIKGGGTTSVTFSASDTSTGIASIDLLYAADGSTFSTLQASATSPYSWTVPLVDTTGSALRVIATDGAGNTSSHTTVGFNIDSTLPNVSLDDMVAIIRGGVSNNVTHIKTDANGIASSELFYAPDGVTFSSVTTNPALTYAWSTPSVNLSTAKLRLSVIDNAGNIRTVTNNAFEIDSTAPSGTISTPSSPILGGSNYNIALTTSDTASIGSISVQYAADGTNFSTVLTTTNSSPYTWTLPTTNTAGSRIRLVTTDSVGNQATYTSGAFNIDSTPSAAPSLSLTSPVYTNSTSNTFTASSCGDVAAILINEGTQPTAGAAGWQTCTTAANAITFTMGATEGAHTLNAWSKDSVGNVSTTSSDFTVYYDVTNPVLAVSNPGLMRGGASYTLNWTLTEQYINNTRSFTVEYWNGSAWNSVGSVAATTGPHTAQGFSTSWTAASLNRTDVKIRVTVTDLAGNSGTAQSTIFEIDSTAPALTIASPAANSYHLSSVVVTGNCETGRNLDFTGALQSDFSVMCSGGSYSQTLNFSDGDGNKLIGVSQTDAAGNTTTLTRNFIRDEVAPILSLTGGTNPDFTNANTPNNWSGTCEGTFNINITGDETTTIPCSSGSWSWTPSPKTSDGTFSYSLTQSDAAGNTTSPALSLSWERDATPPLFNMASPVAISGGGSATDTNNLNQRTLSGSCEGTNTITISGTQSAAISCSASSWSWTTATFTTDATRAYTLQQSDSAGNTTTLSYTWVRDTTGPGLTITANSLKTNTNTVSFSGNCETGVTVNVSGAETSSMTCPSGTWSWTTSAVASDATRNYTFTQTFTVSPFNSTSVSASWIRETDLPTISLFGTDAANPSNNAYIPIDLQATSQNPNVHISEVCFTRLVTTQPASGDECWVGVDSPSIGLPLGQTLTLDNYSMLLGWNTQTYDMYPWVKDEAGNISVLTNAGAGTIGTDKLVHDYDPGVAPTLSDVVAANVNNSQIPPTTSEVSVPAGTNVFIRWKVTDNTIMPSGSIALFYTTDDINYTAISTAQNLDPYSNTGCGAMSLATNEGCYLWPGGSPLNTPYKILVKATDSTSISTQATSNNTNTDIIKVLAGNTEKGIGGSAQTAVFINEGTGDSVDPNTIIYTADGRMFFADYDRGILTVNKDTGKLEVFIPRTGTSTGDGGAATNATLRRAIKINLDYQGRMLILDDMLIRRVDLNQATPTINTIIGGGSDKADTVANALDVQIDDLCDWCNEEDNMPFFAMPNGDIVFFSERPFKNWNISSMPRIRIYKQATGQVISKYYSGTGDSNVPTQDLTLCRLSHFGLSFDENSDFVLNVSFIEKNKNWPGCDNEVGWRKVSYDPETFVAFTPPNDSNRWWNRYHYTGMDGQLYKLGYGGVVHRVNSDGTETNVLGTGTRGECTDGTPATSCNVNYRSFFVNPNGEMFFVDSGSIRVVDPSGNVKTILGQRKTYGDGVLAINSRFEVIRSVVRRNNGDIVVIDGDGYYVKEFTPEGNINVIAGNGNLAAADLGLPAKYNPAHIRNFIQVDKSTGDLFFSRWSQFGNIIRLDRSTGNYEEVIGDPAGTNYDSADGLVGMSIDEGGNDNRGLPIGINGSTLMMTRMAYNNTEGRYGTFRLKAYDRTDSYRQSHVMGINEYPTDGNVRKVCSAASPGPTTASTCDAPHWDTFAEMDYDYTNDRWIAAISIGGTQQNVFAIDINTDTIEQIAYVANDIDDWYKFVRHADNSEALYYCSGGRIRKYDLDAGNDVGALTWPINNLYCRGYRADYNPTNNSLIFPFEQNGLYGVAEYFIP